jgi:hypothetical protein
MRFDDLDFVQVCPECLEIFAMFILTMPHTSSSDGFSRYFWIVLMNLAASAPSSTR